jgi:transposase
VDNQVLTGKTRKGFGRVDRTEISSPDICLNCGSKELSEVINIHRQQVASLVAKPIEVVEYQTQSCKCLECGAVVRGETPQGIVPGLDLSVNLQALLVWLGNYGHLSYAKLQELLWELGRIEVGVGNTPKNQSTSSSSSKASD